LHEIFSALPAISEENREQTINFSDDRQRSKRGKQERIEERISEGKCLRESISETYSPSPKIIINTRDAFTRHSPGKHDIIDQCITTSVNSDYTKIKKDVKQIIFPT
jgi:hypothetical protein